MGRLTCRMGRGQPLAIPGWLDATFVKDVANTFHEASGKSLDLRIDAALLAPPILDTTGRLGSFDLHRALRVLVGAPAKPVDTIGLLLASRYRYGSRVFGIMFDTSFDLDVPAEGSAPSIAGPPREGAAVFIDEIADHRTAGIAQLRQTFHTTVHELGHVFNLTHSNDRCFMHTSDPDTSYEPDEYWHFTPTQASVLRRAEPSEPGIWPGESRFMTFGNEDGEPLATGRRRAPVEIRIGLARENFYHFEPVELDVEVSLATGRSRPVRIGDVVDPGYECFRIWIEEPDGSRRRFRSPRVYCAAGETRVITREAPFHRDISIFGEAGGYAFRRPGMHRLWVEWLLPGCAPCWSNTLEFEVRPIRTAKAASEATLFSTAPVRTVLYHRLDRHRGVGLRALGEWLQGQRAHDAAPSVRYAVARAMAEKIPARRAATAQRQAAVVRRLLVRAADGAMLGTHQRDKALRMLDSDDRLAR